MVLNKLALANCEKKLKILEGWGEEPCAGLASHPGWGGGHTSITPSCVIVKHWLLNLRTVKLRPVYFICSLSSDEKRQHNFTVSAKVH